MSRIGNLSNRLVGLALLAAGVCAATGIGCASQDLTAPRTSGTDEDRGTAAQVDLPVESDGTGGGGDSPAPDQGGRGGKNVDPPSAPEPTDSTTPE